jgi:hypothetical protein
MTLGGGQEPRWCSRHLELPATSVAKGHSRRSRLSNSRATQAQSPAVPRTAGLALQTATNPAAGSTNSSRFATTTRGGRRTLLASFSFASPASSLRTHLLKRTLGIPRGGHLGPATRSGVKPLRATGPDDHLSFAGAHNRAGVRNLEKPSHPPSDRGQQPHQPVRVSVTEGEPSPSTPVGPAQIAVGVP